MKSVSKLQYLIIGSSILLFVLLLIANIDSIAFTTEIVRAAIWDYATNVGRGSVLWPMRYALSGREKSPDPFILADILGKEATIQRITKAITTLNSPMV